MTIKTKQHTLTMFILLLFFSFHYTDKFFFYIMMNFILLKVVSEVDTLTKVAVNGAVGSCTSSGPSEEGCREQQLRQVFIIIINPQRACARGLQ